jgi:hypothetical protein
VAKKATGAELGEALKGMHRAAGIQRRKTTSNNPSRVPVREVLRVNPGRRRLPTSQELLRDTAAPPLAMSSRAPGMPSAEELFGGTIAGSAYERVLLGGGGRGSGDDGDDPAGGGDDNVDRTEYLAPTPSINTVRPRAHEASYNPDTRTLRVVFRHGGTYHYYGVPTRVWRALQRNRSFGQTLDRLVINTYEFEKTAF